MGGDFLLFGHQQPIESKLRYCTLRGVPLQVNESVVYDQLGPKTSASKQFIHHRHRKSRLGAQTKKNHPRDKPNITLT